METKYGLYNYYFYRICSSDRSFNACTSVDCSAWKGFRDSSGTVWMVQQVKKRAGIQKMLDSISEDNSMYFMDINEYVKDLNTLKKLVAAHDFIKGHEGGTGKK